MNARSWPIWLLVNLSVLGCKHAMSVPIAPKCEDAHPLATQGWARDTAGAVTFQRPTRLAWREGGGIDQPIYEWADTSAVLTISLHRADVDPLRELIADERLTPRTLCEVPTASGGGRRLYYRFGPYHTHATSVVLAGGARRVFMLYSVRDSALLVESTMIRNSLQDLTR